MAIVKFSPFKELSAMQDRMNRLFDESFFRYPFRPDIGLTASGWIPAVDIYETDKEIVLKVELPEMEEKDIEIKVEDDTLILQGERKLEKETREEDYHRIERAYGCFSRSFTLPHTVDREKIKAAHKNGVLRISMPKKAESKPKQIKIEAK